MISITFSAELLIAERHLFQALPVGVDDRDRRSLLHIRTCTYLAKFYTFCICA